MEIGHLLQPGDTIFLKRRDVFFGKIIIDQSGSNSAPIVISAFGEGSPPVISGFLRINKWNRHKGNIFSSQVLNTESAPQLVVINSKSCAKGRYPNAGEENGGYLSLNQVGHNWIKHTGGNSQDWSGGQLVIRSTRWTLEKRRISTQRSMKIHYAEPTAYSLKSDFGYFIQDHLATLDEHGEWFFDSNTKRFYICFGNRLPYEQKVQVAIRDHLIAISGSNITIENIQLEGANKYAIFSGDTKVTGINLRNINISYSGVDGININNCTYLRIEDCEILNSNNCGIKLLYDNPHAKIIGNTIRNTGLNPGMGGSGDGHYVAIYSTSKGLQLVDNKIINTGYTAVRFEEDNIFIKNNFIDTFCLVMDDGGGIYTYKSTGVKKYDRRIYNNIILNGIGAPQGTPGTDAFASGIYIDDHSTEVEIEGNTVAHSNRGIYVHNSKNLSITNNTLYDNDVQFSIRKDDKSIVVEDLKVFDNVFFAKLPTQWLTNLYSFYNDFHKFGNFESNYYSRPLKDSLGILVEYLNNNTQMTLPLTLKEWRAQYSKDNNSHRSPKKVDFFMIDSMGENQIPFGDFTTSAPDVWCWSQSSSCKAEWGYSHELESGAVHFTNQGFSNLGIQAGPMEKDQLYLVKFSAHSSRNNNMLVYIQKSGSPWTKLTESQSIAVNNKKQDFQLVFHSKESQPRVSVQISTSDKKGTHWIDNMVFTPILAGSQVPDSVFRFEYNASHEIKDIKIDRSYIGVRGHQYDSNIALYPFQSKILILSEQYKGQSVITEDAIDNPGMGPGNHNSFSGQSRNIMDDVFIYPNPAKSVIYIDLSQIEHLPKNVGVLDEKGKMILQNPVPSTAHIMEMDLGNQRSGIYFLAVILDSGQTLTKKFTVFR